MFLAFLLVTGGWGCWQSRGNHAADVEEEEEPGPDRPVCGNGFLDAGEECDDGTANSDTRPNSCRTDCLNPWCGDGILDDMFDEQCDDGSLNSDERPDACRTDCRLASCGDGVADDGEGCDDGAGNNDTAPDACRTDCTNGPCRIDYCPNDAPDPDPDYNGPCISFADCDDEAYCETESVEVFDGEIYISWLGGQCLLYSDYTTVCDPDIPDSCPSGLTCLWVRDNEYTHDPIFGCFDACVDASSEGVPWVSNCDCREGYSCQPDPGSTVLMDVFCMTCFQKYEPLGYSFGRLVGGVCIPGCSNDRECCEIWHDDDEDKYRDAGEVTLLPPAECTDTCNDCTYACERNGCTDGECRIGDPCEHPAQCPPNGICLDEFRDGVPGGLCTKVQCDLIGRECPAEAGCAGMGGTAADVKGCVVPCEPGSGPGDPGYACRDLGVTGVADAGDGACYPVGSGFWLDGTIAGGFCWPGNFAGGSVAIGGGCSGDTDCASPLGLGACIDDGVNYPSLGMPFCTVHCDVALAQGGICGGPGTDGIATGACVAGEILGNLRRHDCRKASSTLRTTSGLCLESCENPGASPEASATGCSQDGMACIPVGLLGPDVHVVERSSMPAGLCFPACTDDVWCAKVWPDGGFCNATSDVSGVCEP
jgi:hypothetical protein